MSLAELKSVVAEAKRAGLGVAAINVDVAHQFAGSTQHRHLAQFLLHHPFQFQPGEPVDTVDIQEALVIRHNDVGLARLDIAPAVG